MKADITDLFPMGSFNAKNKTKKTKQDKTKNSEKILKREN